MLQSHTNVLSLARHQQKVVGVSLQQRRFGVASKRHSNGLHVLHSWDPNVMNPRWLVDLPVLIGAEGHLPKVRALIDPSPTFC